MKNQFIQKQAIMFLFYVDLFKCKEVLDSFVLCIVCTYILIYLIKLKQQYCVTKNWQTQNAMIKVAPLNSKGICIDCIYPSVRILLNIKNNRSKFPNGVVHKNF